ncbi:MAG: hypothetical protein IT378_18145 [Sandaracinaceae bacterium]|nr:hypothetical protein [Sandaracinaceae bacterium]
MVFPKPIDVVPHRPPMLLIDEIVDQQGRKIHCRTTLREDGLFVRGGEVSSVLAIELFAQAASALIGLVNRDRARSGESTGALLGSRSIELRVPSFAAGDVLDIECEELLSIEAAAQVACTLKRRGELVAQGTVNVFAGAASRGQASGAS